jgi:hypothetical protein
MFVLLNMCECACISDNEYSEQRAQELNGALLQQIKSMQAKHSSLINNSNPNNNNDIGSNDGNDGDIKVMNNRYSKLVQQLKAWKAKADQKSTLVR